MSLLSVICDVTVARLRKAPFAIVLSENTKHSVNTGTQYESFRHIANRVVIGVSEGLCARREVTVTVARIRMSEVTNYVGCVLLMNALQLSHFTRYLLCSILLLLTTLIRWLVLLGTISLVTIVVCRSMHCTSHVLNKGM